jgi:hypothetical protein
MFITSSSRSSASPAPSSAIWAYFREPQGDESLFDQSGSKKQKKRYCMLCDGNNIWSTAYTTNAKNHLRKKHHVNIDDGNKLSLNVYMSIKADAVLDSSSSSVLGSSQPFTGPEMMIRKSDYLEALVTLVCRRRLPFNIVTWPEFRKFCLVLNPTIETLLISSRSTLVNHITKVYDFHRLILRKRLQSAKSMIHFSADMWSSPNRLSLIGVCVQWIGENYTLQKALLGLPECQTGHSGPQQASHIMELVRWFDIGRNLGYFTSDNASSNDTCIRAISETLSNEYDVVSQALFTSDCKTKDVFR